MNRSSWKAPARAARRSSPTIDRIASKATVLRQLRHDPVIIYSMGKAGTSTLTSSIAAATSRHVIKVHAVSPAGIEERRSTHGPRPRLLWTGEVLRHDFHRRRARTVVTCVRDPIARAISAYFYSGRTDTSIDTVSYYVEKLSQRDWFDDEMLATTGLDVYAKTFDHDRGYEVYEHENLRVLLLRVEDIRRVGPTALREHLGLARPPLIVTQNVGEDQGQGDVYTAFKRTVALPQNLVSMVYATRLARHFYSPDELAALTERWTTAKDQRSTER